MATVDYFLKIKGIEGEANDAKHPNEIELESWSFGESNSGTHAGGSGGGAGKVQMQDFHFVMKVNKASPKLFLACANGEHIPDAVLTCRKAGKEQQEFLKYKFYDLLISSYNTGGSSAGPGVIRLPLAGVGRRRRAPRGGRRRVPDVPRARGTIEA